MVGEVPIKENDFNGGGWFHLEKLERNDFKLFLIKST